MQLGWSSLWRGALLALGIVFAMSTQLLFQLDLYGNWPLPAILLGWLDHFVDQAIVGASIFAAVVAALLIPARSLVARGMWLALAIVLGAVTGEALLILHLAPPPDMPMAAMLLAKVVRWLVIAGLACAFLLLRRQAAEAATQAHEQQLQRIQLDRQMTEARAQSLHAQIEPHFLFNTLANVQRLYRTDPERGRKMLTSFLAYLRAALPQMRSSETTLRREVDLARAYLEILQLRMGERLTVRFEVPRHLAELPFPPFALSTLTENAIKHGLNPLPRGGSIEITAWSEGGRLRVRVADTGTGLRGSSGTGAGLANLRARLAVLYGDEGELDFQANVPSGIRATIAVPIRADVLEAA